MLEPHEPVCVCAVLLDVFLDVFLDAGFADDWFVDVLLEVVGAGALDDD